MPIAGTGSALGSTIASTLTGLSDADKGSPDKIWQEVAKAIVAHIVANLTVTTSVAGTPTPGVIT